MLLLLPPGAAVVAEVVGTSVAAALPPPPALSPFPSQVLAPISHSSKYGRRFCDKSRGLVSLPHRGAESMTRPTSHAMKDYGVALEAQALGNIVLFALRVGF